MIIIKKFTVKYILQSIYIYIYIIIINISAYHVEYFIISFSEYAV
jgi:hypothetical protein